MSYLIDSDWVIDYLRGLPPAVSLLESLEPQGLAISIITFGEVLEGIIYGRGRQEHEDSFRRFLRRVDVVTLSRVVMRRFAGLRGELRLVGRSLADLDLLIAATALHHHGTLVTRNRRHFDRVPGLQLYEAS